jgi:hypothetical protein
VSSIVPVAMTMLLRIALSTVSLWTTAREYAVKFRCVGSNAGGTRAASASVRAEVSSIQ